MKLLGPANSQQTDYLIQIQSSVYQMDGDVQKSNSKTIDQHRHKIYSSIGQHNQMDSSIGKQIDNQEIKFQTNNQSRDIGRHFSISNL